VLANIDANPSIPLTSVFDDVVVRVSNATHVMLVFLIVFFALSSTWMDCSSLQ
jgi:solute carrier family 38 (sodium-coupled neutral amino acid transporter), member 2